jgi:hypothetical protein
VAVAPSRWHLKQQEEIYDASTKLESVSSYRAGRGAVETSNLNSDRNYAPDSKPEPIDLFRPEPSTSEAALADAPEGLDLVIDEAGKVRKAKLVGKGEDKDLIAATAGWKFIPAFKDGRAVVCRLLFEVRGRQ